MSIGRAEVQPADEPRVITVTLSPAWDITITASQLDLGRSHRIDPAVGRLGGKGINVARILADTGIGAYVQGPVAGEYRPEADSAAGVEASPALGPVWDLTPTPSRLRRSYAVVEGSGRATVLNETAAKHPPEVWDALSETIDRRLSEPAVTVLVLSGSTPADCPEDFHAKLVRAAHAAGVSVIVDTSGPGLLRAARAGADWVKPNAEELNELFEHKDLFEHEDLIASAGELVRAGASNVLVSRGEDGMVLVDRTGPRSSARLERVLQGNPTGAGDASVAALARCLAANSQSDEAARLPDEDVRTILTEAVALSASAVLMPQAGQIHPDWQKLRHDVVITKEQT
ncbi:1-phosphofructokinase family hexose kinase [Brevibacterium sp. UCMA 11754]|uniref:1-phosphofructokinase family hexose kinase n=1 Tax=Brevibacterium sp. UCMA 11754 TaxID=2749198 RepID=UPI001F2FFBD4|nr:PfkB family carbohydrate kinase [Brevibacterium sp. UCMA 11754]MCF2572020.1 bifunctional hydroxymethylpyrimidine kinase/phosphomethylpyrimidine kinase [Brevibacterium sp. UCMA 11754]MCF2572268.1 bifunctional hydroxymethylpyrimidine kinase/phosphomethylpyrimidine kinase [Brevibacterium sp. UCMA 11754]